MRTRDLLVLLFLLAFSLDGFTQILKPVPVLYSNENRKLQQTAFLKPVVIAKVVQQTSYTPAFLNATNLKCTLPKGAIFCRMEDAIYNRLNFWVKFRMGTDDKYSN